jgi:hypothetical protein
LRRHADTLFLERGDEVIDTRIAERIYADCGRLMVWDGRRSCVSASRRGDRDDPGISRISKRH